MKNRDFFQPSPPLSLVFSMAKSTTLVRLYYVKVFHELKHTVCRDRKFTLRDKLVQLESILTDVANYEKSLLLDLDVD